MMTLRRFFKEETGFSIAELLMAVTLLSIGVVFVIGMFDMSLTTATRATTRNLANNLVQEKIESIRTMLYDNITTDTGHTPNLQGVLGLTATRGGVTFTLTYTVTTIDDPGDNPALPEVDADTADYKKVTVVASWTSPKPAGSVRLETMINRNPLPPPGVSGDTTPPNWPNGSPLTGYARTGSAGPPIVSLCNYIQWSPNWATDNQGVVGYLVYRKEGADPDFLLIATIAPSVGFYEDIIYTAGLTYDYYVKAFDAAGNISALTNTVSMVALADTQAPSVPTNLQYQLIGSTIRLDWNASTDNAGVTHYHIWINKNGSWKMTPEGESTSTSFYSSPGTGNYWFKISAVDGAGNESGQSQENGPIAVP